MSPIPSAAARIGFDLFGRAANRSGPLLRLLDQVLMRAHRFQRPEGYLATTYLYTAMAAVAGALAATALVGFHQGGLLPGGTGLWTLAAVVVLVPAGTTLLVRLAQPYAEAHQRARDIDAKLPYALSYVSTMASAGMPPERIFAGLSRQEVYGEVAREASLVRRDLEVLGLDLMSSLQRGIERSPSPRMRDLLQGAVTALRSGEDLDQYFLAKSEQYAQENREGERQFLDSLGVLAESYVTMVVAAPVFLIVLLSVLLVFGGAPKQIMALGYGLVLLLIPLAQAGFALGLKTITPEV